MITMTEKVRYTAAELEEFEILLNEKLEKSRNELKQLKETIKRDAADYDANASLKTMESGAETFEKEQLNQLAARIQKYINQLEKALFRIKNGTYGVCVETGRLIPKERLRIVPHTQYSVDGKK